jgi:hypothetical protein
MPRFLLPILALTTLLAACDGTSEGGPGAAGDEPAGSTAGGSRGGTSGGTSGGTTSGTSGGTSGGTTGGTSGAEPSGTGSANAEGVGGGMGAEPVLEPGMTAPPAAPLELEPPERGPWFVELDGVLQHRDLSGPTDREGKVFLLDCIGKGLAVLDFDGDGRLDLYFPQGRGPGAQDPSAAGSPDSRNVLYRNLGQRRFERVPDAAGADDDGYGFGALAFDADGDGDDDLLATSYGPNRLYRNDGGRFADVSGHSPDLVGPPEFWSTGAAAADVDGDGDLDVYLANYLEHDGPALEARGPCRFMGCLVPCGPLGLTPQADRFLRNEDGRFVDATDEAGFGEVSDSFGFQPVFTDVDDDGDLDLYVTNDSRANSLFLADGAGADGDGARGHFTEDGLVVGAAVGRQGNLEAGMGVAAGDLSGDLLPEIHVTNFSNQFNSLYVNESVAGLPWFDERSEAVGLGRPTWLLLSWGCQFLDADQDGWVDVVVANGHVYPQVDACEPDQVVYRQPNSLFRRMPGDALTFEDLGAAAGAPFARPGPHRGSVAAELDGDGALDLVVTRLDEPPLLAFNESPGRGASLLVTLEHRVSDDAPWTLAVGARATVPIDEHEHEHDRVLTREVRRGGSFLCTEDPRLHFGLGEADAVTLELRWPDGGRQMLEDVPTGIAIRVRQGDDPAWEVMP